MDEANQNSRLPASPRRSFMCFVFFPASSNVNRRAPMTSNANFTTESQLRSRRKAAKMLVAVVVMFAVCYFPVHLLDILRYEFFFSKLDPKFIINFFFFSNFFSQIHDRRAAKCTNLDHCHDQSLAVLCKQRRKSHHLQHHERYVRIRSKQRQLLYVLFWMNKSILLAGKFRKEFQQTFGFWCCIIRRVASRRRARGNSSVTMQSSAYICRYV